jgi:hypothetical protein
MMLLRFAAVSPLVHWVVVLPTWHSKAKSLTGLLILEDVLRQEYPASFTGRIGANVNQRGGHGGVSITPLLVRHQQ